MNVKIYYKTSHFDFINHWKFGLHLLQAHFVCNPAAANLLHQAEILLLVAFVVKISLRCMADFSNSNWLLVSSFTTINSSFSNECHDQLFCVFSEEVEVHRWLDFRFICLRYLDHNHQVPMLYRFSVVNCFLDMSF